MALEISERSDGLYASNTRYDFHYRRISGTWEMLGTSENWFPLPDGLDPADQRQVEDYEFCLRTYAFDEGPKYPGGKKKDVGAFFRELQRRELWADTKKIFAPVETKYDASAENRARVNREVATRMRARFNSAHLTGN